MPYFLGSLGHLKVLLDKMVHRLVEPFLSLFRKLPLQFGGLDFTVLVALLVLNVLNQLLGQLFLQLIG